MKKIEKLLEIMARLRDPEKGCPWDIKQTFASVAPYTLEEAYEVADAIEQGDMDALKGELGDLLLQVVFHAQIAKEADLFAFADVVEAICNKLIRRHPHVFADMAVESSAQLHRVWEAEKKAERIESQERKNSGNDAQAARLLSGISRNLPAVMRAMKLQKRAAAVGFDWQDYRAVIEKLHEELAELIHAAEKQTADEIEDEMGDLLFVCTNIARKLKIDPEMALRRANQKFENRFNLIEDLLEAKKIALEDAGVELLEQLWIEAKQIEKAKT